MTMYLVIINRWLEAHFPFYAFLYMLVIVILKPCSYKNIRVSHKIQDVSSNL